MAKKLFTIGYEGIDIDNFISNLKSNAITCLLDIREVPISRKPGFSKSALIQRLGQENIDYIHFKELGSPKPIRNRLKETKNYSRFFTKMDSYISSKKEFLEKAYKYVVNENSCLMCFEHLATTCHRKIVASKINEISGGSLSIMNI